MTEKDYINKKSLYEDFMMLAKTQNGERQQGILGCAATVLMQTPADVVSVVRCKDCKYLMFSDCYGECSRGYLGIVRPDCYCCYGEKKER